MKIKSFLWVALCCWASTGGVGCISKDSPGGGAAPQVTPSSLPSFSASCKSQVFDTGQKGIIAGVGRGAYSDVATSSLGYPVMAYTDSGSVSLKLSYWNGTSFNSEVISGDGSGAFVKLALTSTDIPVVVWTLGTHLKAAIRSAPIGNEGSWDAGIIDTGTGPRAANISINPLDQVVVSFLTGTNTTDRAKILFCDAGCSLISQFQTMNTVTTVDNTAIVGAQTGMGLSWCQADATTFYPVVSYGGNTNQIRFAICKNSLSTCLNGSNWTAVNAFAAASVNTTLVMDPKVVGDVPKIIALKPATGLKAYKMGAVACTGTLGAFSESAATLGVAATGNVWLSATKEGSGSFHVVANESTTNVRYYNSQTTDITGAWNTVGNVETVTLASPMRGGISLAGSSLFVSYGQGAAPFDLRLAKVNNTAVASSAATYGKFVPDMTGGLQLTGSTASTYPVKNIATASTSDGKLGVAYVDYSVGAIAGAKLKYSLRSGSSFSDSWSSVVVPYTNTPSFPALAFDKDNHPWIAYYEGSGVRYILMNNTESDGSGAWSVYEFPYVPGVAPLALPAANQVALVMVTEAAVSKPVLIVADNKSGSIDVKAAKFNPQTLSWGALAAIDAPGALGVTHLTADSLGNKVVIAYYDINLSKVKYNYSADGDTWQGSGTSFAFSGMSRGIGATIRIHPITQKPIASYFDKTNNRLYFAQCSGTLASCFGSGWTETVIENGTLGVNGLASTHEQLLTASLSVNPSGVISMIYSRGQGTSGELMMAHNEAGSWSTLALAQAQYGALPGSPVYNFGMGGWNPVHLSNGAYSPSGFYVGPGNWLYQFSCGE